MNTLSTSPSPQSDRPLLEARDLVKSYSGRTVVNKVCFHVGHGEIVGLLGRNGAGKTTSFRMTMGIVKPDGGHVLLNGEEISHLPMYRRAQKGVGYLSQENSVFVRLSVEDNLLAILELNRSLSTVQRKQKAHQLMEQFGLLKNSRQEARTLSGGERRKLEIARALITQPAIILLDEPFSGVDPIAVQDLQKEIRHLRESMNLSFLLTDHNVRQTLEVTDRSYIIHEGAVIAQGPPRQLINDPLVRSTYLGNTFRGDEFDQTATPPVVRSA
ncbi:MAG TPA: LPS export ABC transporter ATP-binding protein [Phycisphaerae bacterium]|nr:LPS export ABC transporter ATP-binding protein [Phycisphaerae bacterium]